MLAALLLLGLVAGCGTTKQQIATEQLLASDAVDRSVSRLDFSPLAGRSVYLDTQYINQIKDLGFVNAEYVISSLRQQLFASRCLIQDNRDRADVIVEARVGTLGNDGHEINYGLSSNGNALNAAAAAVSSQPWALLPDFSLARRNQQTGAAKVAVFAYQRETKEPLWQSGTSIAFSNARQTWILGAGPFQSGTIYDSPRLAGTRLRIPKLLRPSESVAADPLLSAFRKKRGFGEFEEQLGAEADPQLATRPLETRSASYQTPGDASAAPDAGTTPAATPGPKTAPPLESAPDAAPAPAGASATLPAGG